MAYEGLKKYASLPSPEALKAELNKAPVPGIDRGSAVQFGCNECPNGSKFVAGWLSLTRLIEMMDREEEVPRGFATDCFASIGRATACSIDSSGDVICSNEDELKTLHNRVNRFPD